VGIFLKGKLTPILGLPLWDSFFFGSGLAILHGLDSSVMFSYIGCVIFSIFSNFRWEQIGNGLCRYSMNELIYSHITF
jgi:hypothetical protein